MAQNYQDAMAVCHWVGYPNLFVTFTSNANWPEIQYMLDEAKLKQKPAERGDVIVRVFMIKLKALLRDIVIGKRFRETTTGICLKPLYIQVYEILMITNKLYGFYVVLYTIEFQKRGLPHAHILIFLKDRSKSHDPSQIDQFISTGIQD
jgi:hypothetical protein